MILMQPVLEVSDAGDLLVLSDALTRAEVTAALASISRASGGLADAECLIAPGGLLLSDPATGVVVPPGCCFGLESWRDWESLARGQSPDWLGHDPGTEVAFLPGDRIRVRVIGPRTKALELRREEVKPLLAGVREGLLGFLDRVADHGPQGDGGALVRKLDAEFRITTGKQGGDRQRKG
ncbi:hypothetical protein ACWGDE_15800 [Streptomyces sp. NPDC054956]